VDEANLLSPDLVTVWAGPNDVLGAALAGAAIDGVTLTPVAAFEAKYTEIMTGLRATGRTVVALNIPDVAWGTAQHLARHFQNVDALLGATQEELVECEGIGADRAESIAEWFADEDNRRLVEELRNLGLTFEADEDDLPKEGPLTGSQYVITGTLESFTREEAKAALEALGAKVSDSVSKKTTALVVGEEPGASKVKKAQTASVPTLDEQGLRRLLQPG